MKNKNKSHSVGSYGEQRAVNYLRIRGYTVKERNYRAGHHEIDIIASRLGVLAFVEVKARSYHREELDIAPPPRIAVHSDKQRFTRQAARQYLYEHPSSKKPRMDLIEVWVDADSPKGRFRTLRINHMKGAY